MKKLEDRIRDRLTFIEGFFADSEYTEASYYWSGLNTEIKRLSAKTLTKNVSKTTMERWFRSYYTIRLPSRIATWNTQLTRPEPDGGKGYHNVLRNYIEDAQVELDEWVAAGKPNHILEIHE